MAPTQTKTLKLIVHELNDYITSATPPTHLNRRGVVVYRYHDIHHRLSSAPNQFEIMSILTGVMGFEPIPTYNSYALDCFSKEHLANVSWCEGDVFIVICKDLEEYEKEKSLAIEFYRHG